VASFDVEMAELWLSCRPIFTRVPLTDVISNSEITVGKRN